MLYIIMIVAFLLMGVLATTYIWFRTEIFEIRRKVLAGSEILRTEDGQVLEYAVRGTKCD